MDLAANLERIRRDIAAAAERAGRDPASVELMAVSKGHPPETVRAAADLGLTLFGENKVQEGKAKIPLCPHRLRWHLIGHLQSNKCRDALLFFEVIQGVDSLALARELNRWAEQLSRRARILIEVNVAGESSKFGCSPDRLLAEIEEINRLPRVEILGLMTMAPWTTDAEKTRPVFRRLRELREEAGQILGAPLPQLSMGMSGDFTVAVEEGSTMVRLGTALFGPRASAWKPRAAAAP